MSRPARRRWQQSTVDLRPFSDAARQPVNGNYVPARPCRCGKRGYVNRSDARTVVREMKRNGDPNPDALRSYQCTDDTTHWHVGHTAPDGRPNLNDPRIRFA